MGKASKEHYKPGIEVESESNHCKVFEAIDGSNCYWLLLPYHHSASPLFVVDFRHVEDAASLEVVCLFCNSFHHVPSIALHNDRKQ